MKSRCQEWRLVLSSGARLGPGPPPRPPAPPPWGGRVTLDLGARNVCFFRFFLRLFARVDERGGPDEAADVIGAERRLGAFHVRGHTWQRHTDRVLPDDSTRGRALM